MTAPTHAPLTPRWDRLRTEAHIRYQALKGAADAAYDADAAHPTLASFVRVVRAALLKERAWRRLTRRITGQPLPNTDGPSRAYAARALAYHHPEWEGTTDGR